MQIDFQLKNSQVLIEHDLDLVLLCNFNEIHLKCKNKYISKLLTFNKQISRQR